MEFLTISIADFRKSIKACFERVNSGKIAKLIITSHGNPIGCIIKSSEIHIKGYHTGKPNVNRIMAWYVDPFDIALKSRWRTARNDMHGDGKFYWIDKEGGSARFKFWKLDIGEPSPAVVRNRIAIDAPRKLTPTIQCKEKWCRSRIDVDNSSIDSLVESTGRQGWTAQVEEGKFFGAVCNKHESEF